MVHYHRTHSTRLIVEGFRSHEASGATSRIPADSLTPEGCQRLLYRLNPAMVVTRSRREVPVGRGDAAASSRRPASPSARCPRTSALHALRTWLDSQAGIGWRSAWRARATICNSRATTSGWRATFSTTGMEHSPMSATACWQDARTGRHRSSEIASTKRSGMTNWEKGRSRKPGEGRQGGRRSEEVVARVCQRGARPM